jgi:hypothetical protein
MKFWSFLGLLYSSHVIILSRESLVSRTI